MRNMLKSVLFIVIIAMLVTACGNNNNASQKSTSSSEPVASPAKTEETVEAEPVQADGIDLPPAEKTKLIMRLNWKIKGEFVPFLVAKEKGFYEKYGLDVEVLEGAGSVKTMQAIAQGDDDFGVTSSVEPMQGIEQGMGVKMIASYMTKSPLLVISYPDNPIKTPADMEGKSVGTSADSVFTAIFDELVKSNGADLTKTKLVKLDYAAKNALFMNKQVDGIEVFATNEYAFFEKELGLKLETLYTADFGFDIAGLMMIANDDFLAANPNTTKRFLAATSEGFQYAFDNPEEAAAIAKKVFPDAVDEPLIMEQIKRTKELAKGIEGKPMGWIDEANIDKTATQLVDTNLIKSKLPLTDYYTNEYIVE